MKEIADLCAGIYKTQYTTRDSHSCHRSVAGRNFLAADEKGIYKI